MERKRQILFLDDDGTTNFYHQELIETLDDWSGECKFCIEPEAALELMKKDDFDVLFLDINMPRISGWEFLDIIADKLTRLPRIYMLSTSIDPRDHQRAESHALVTAFCAKPLAPSQLGELIAI